MPTAYTPTDQNLSTTYTEFVGTDKYKYSVDNIPIEIFHDRTFYTLLRHGNARLHFGATPPAEPPAGSATPVAATHIPTKEDPEAFWVCTDRGKRQLYRYNWDNVSTATFSPAGAGSTITLTPVNGTYLQKVFTLEDPIPNKQYIVEVVVGGAIGVATYQWSNDNGDNWTGPIGPGAGTYTLDDGTYEVDIVIAEPGAGGVDAGDRWYFNTEPLWVPLEVQHTTAVGPMHYGAAHFVIVDNGGTFVTGAKTLNIDINGTTYNVGPLPDPVSLIDLQELIDETINPTDIDSLTTAIGTLEDKGRAFIVTGDDGVARLYVCSYIPTYLTSPSTPHPIDLTVDDNDGFALMNALGIPNDGVAATVFSSAPQPVLHGDLWIDDYTIIRGATPVAYGKGVFYWDQSANAWTRVITAHADTHSGGGVLTDPLITGVPGDIQVNDTAAAGTIASGVAAADHTHGSPDIVNPTDDGFMTWNLLGLTPMVVPGQYPDVYPNGGITEGSYGNQAIFIWRLKDITFDGGDKTLARFCLFARRKPTTSADTVLEHHFSKRSIMNRGDATTAGVYSSCPATTGLAGSIVVTGSAAPAVGVPTEGSWTMTFISATPTPWGVHGARNNGVEQGYLFISDGAGNVELAYYDAVNRTGGGPYTTVFTVSRRQLGNSNYAYASTDELTPVMAIPTPVGNWSFKLEKIISSAPNAYISHIGCPAQRQTKTGFTLGVAGSARARLYLKNNWETSPAGIDDFATKAKPLAWGNNDFSTAYPYGPVLGIVGNTHRLIYNPMFISTVVGGDASFLPSSDAVNYIPYEDDIYNTTYSGVTVAGGNVVNYPTNVTRWAYLLKDSAVAPGATSDDTIAFMSEKEVVLGWQYSAAASSLSLHVGKLVDIGIVCDTPGGNRASMNGHILKLNIFSRDTYTTFNVNGEMTPTYFFCGAYHSHQFGHTGDVLAIPLGTVGPASFNAPGFGADRG